MAGVLGHGRAPSGVLGAVPANNPYEINPYFDVQFPALLNALTPEQMHILQLLHGATTQPQAPNQPAPPAPWTIFPSGGVRG